MNKKIMPIISVLLLVMLAGVFLAACGSGSTQAPVSSSSTPADGQSLLQTRCTQCHSLSRVTTSQQNSTQWKATVDKMIRNGAELTPQEEQVLVNYLAQTYP